MKLEPIPEGRKKEPVVPCCTPEEIKKGNEKKSPLLDYVGLWVGDKGDNEPVAYFLPNFITDENKEAIASLFGSKFILAKVKLGSRPLVTRANLRGTKNLILDILEKNSPATTSEGA